MGRSKKKKPTENIKKYIYVADKQLEGIKYSVKHATFRTVFIGILFFIVALMFYNSEGLNNGFVRLFELMLK